MKFLFFTICCFILSIVIAHKSPSDSLWNLFGLIAAPLFLTLFAEEVRRNYKYLKFYPRLIYLYLSRSKLRLTISYLIRVESQDKYLLVFAHRTQVWGPVGGVYKFINSSVKDKFCLEKDNGFSDSPSDDMRVSLSGKNVFNLINFLKWFDDNTEREIAPSREFSEELFEENILDFNEFKMPTFHFLKTIRSFNYSEHLQTWEFRLFDIYSLKLNSLQKRKLEELSSLQSDKVKLFSADEIERRGFSNLNKESKIGDHASNIL